MVTDEARTYYIFPRAGKMFHRRLGCVPEWHHSEALKLTLKEMARLGFKPCHRCWPTVFA